MPLYNYRCACGFHTSISRSMDSVEKKPVCVKCSKEMVRVFYAPPIQFKGSGWGKDA